MSDCTQTTQTCSTMTNLKYNVEDNPGIFLSIIYGAQHFITSVGSSAAIPLLLASALCIQDTDYGMIQKAKLISTILVTGGVVTIVQTLFGLRLPILQGGTFSFLAATFAILGTDGPSGLVCPVPMVEGNDTLSTTFVKDEEGLLLFIDNDNTTVNEDTLWKSRMLHLQGAILVAGLTEAFIGFIGAVGLLTKLVSPLTITVFISLIGLALFETAASTAGSYWPISLLMVLLMVLFSNVLDKYDVPCPSLSIKKRSCKISKISVFKTMPVILSIVITWFFCWILTVSNALPENNKARTDLNTEILSLAPWFNFPYPFQWGTKFKFSVAGIVGMLAGSLASIIESIGDYYACANICKKPPPPQHAISRGIMIEGLGCVFAALMGSGNGTTSYSENIGILEVTKIASRTVVATGGCCMIVFGIFTKFAALFVAMPEPILGGLFVVMFGIITSVGLSNLQFVDLNSSRNLMILGLSIILGMGVPRWMETPENKESLKTNVDALDQLFEVLLTTSMFLGGIICMILDLVLPGSPEERGIAKWKKKEPGNRGSKLYWPISFCQFKWFSVLPICPDFRKESEETSFDNGAYG